MYEHVLCSCRPHSWTQSPNAYSYVLDVLVCTVCSDVALPTRLQESLSRVLSLPPSASLRFRLPGEHLAPVLFCECKYPTSTPAASSLSSLAMHRAARQGTVDPSTNVGEWSGQVCGPVSRLGGGPISAHMYFQSLARLDSWTVVGAWIKEIFDVLAPASFWNFARHSRLHTYSHMYEDVLVCTTG